jgi:hypothetical protein
LIASSRGRASQVAITATDLNEPMLDFAKLQPGGERIQWRSRWRSDPIT